MNIKSENLLNEIEKRKEDLIDLTQKLIRIPTLNPPGNNYLEICEFLKQRMEKNGFETKLIRAYDTPGDSNKFPRWNLVSFKDGVNKGNTIHFNGHTDVVETGNDWSVDPFEGKYIDGLIYGRGACDMKGGIAASIIAVECFVAVSPNYSGRIELSFTADEETGGYGGVAFLANEGYFSPDRISSVIIPEPLNKNRICLGHRGVWWAEIETFGKIAHGSMPFLGDSAIRHMGAVLKEFEEKLYPKLKTIKTNMPVVPEGAKSSTMNINSIHGGEAEQEKGFSGYPAPVVADNCKIVIDRRFLIEEEILKVKKDVDDILKNLEKERENFSYKITDLHEVIPTMTDKNSRLVSELTSSIKEILGVNPDYVISPGTYDQKHIERIGKLKNCVAYGPGILDLAHQPDEYISVNDMLDSAKVMALSLEKMLI
tara:strand:+ start:652 stop:1932 length:1281 start_codon:yes stop_codon:yes gene_type:complete